MKTVAIDLSSLPPPEIVQQLTAEQILNELLASFHALMPDFDLKVGDPLYNALVAQANHEVALRAEFQDYALESTLAYSTDKNLDLHASPLVRKPNETDDELRARAQSHVDTYTTAGPAAAYEQIATESHTNVRSAAAISPSAGVVNVFILSNIGNGWATPELLEVVNSALSPTRIRPLAELVTIKSAEIIEYDVVATIHHSSGPSAAITLANAKEAAQHYADETHRLGTDISISGYIAALKQPGVSHVDVNMGGNNQITVAANQAAFCRSLAVELAS